MLRNDFEKYFWSLSPSFIQGDTPSQNRRLPKTAFLVLKTEDQTKADKGRGIYYTELLRGIQQCVHNLPVLLAVGSARGDRPGPQPLEVALQGIYW